MFNITSKYFSIFNNKPPASRIAHISRDFHTCYSCLYLVPCLHQKIYCSYYDDISAIYEDFRYAKSAAAAPYFFTNYQLSESNRIFSIHVKTVSSNQKYWKMQKNTTRDTKHCEPLSIASIKQLLEMVKSICNYSPVKEKKINK